MKILTHSISGSREVFGQRQQTTHAVCRQIIPTVNKHCCLRGGLDLQPEGKGESGYRLSRPLQTFGVLS